MRTLVIGDIHGAHKALVQAFERASFNPEEDHLISLGDLTDTHPDNVACVEELMKVRNLVAVIGNHDVWMREFLESGAVPGIWVQNGGRAAVRSYIQAGKNKDKDHLRFFRQQVPYHVDDSNRLFVHAGFHPGIPIEEQSPERLCWDRDFWKETVSAHMAGKSAPSHPFAEVFLGHTPTSYHFDHEQPVQVENIWNLDQGVKHGGPLTIMDIETKEYWQSDPSRRLYG